MPIFLRTETQELGISTTSLKRLCRTYGINGWPYRQIAGVDRKIKRKEVELQSSQDHLAPGTLQSMATDIRDLRLRRQEMVEVMHVVVLIVITSTTPHLPFFNK